MSHAGPGIRVGTLIIRWNRENSSPFRGWLCDYIALQSTRASIVQVTVPNLKTFFSVLGTTVRKASSILIRQD